jgi:hypothetical protein
MGSLPEYSVKTGDARGAYTQSCFARRLNVGHPTRESAAET